VPVPGPGRTASPAELRKRFLVHDFRERRRAYSWRYYVLCPRAFCQDPPAPPFIDLLSAISPDELLVGFNNSDVANVIRYCLTYTATDKSGSTTADQTASCTLEGAANTSFIVVRLSNLMPYTNYRIQVRLGKSSHVLSL